MPLYRQDLNAMPCCKCGKAYCDDPVVILTASCHPAAGQKIEYNKQTGVMQFHCLECGQFVADLLIAEDPQRPGRN